MNKFRLVVSEWTRDGKNIPVCEEAQGRVGWSLYLFGPNPPCPCFTFMNQWIVSLVDWYG